MRVKLVIGLSAAAIIAGIVSLVLVRDDAPTSNRDSVSNLPVGPSLEEAEEAPVEETPLPELTAGPSPSASASPVVTRRPATRTPTPRPRTAAPTPTPKKTVPPFPFGTPSSTVRNG